MHTREKSQPNFPRRFFTAHGPMTNLRNNPSVLLRHSASSLWNRKFWKQKPRTHTHTHTRFLLQSTLKTGFFSSTAMTAQHLTVCFIYSLLMFFFVATERSFEPGSCSDWFWTLSRHHTLANLAKFTECLASSHDDSSRGSLVFTFRYHLITFHLFPSLWGGQQQAPELQRTLPTSWPGQERNLPAVRDFTTGSGSDAVTRHASTITREANSSRKCVIKNKS